MRPVRKPALLPTRVFPRDVMARARRKPATSGATVEERT